MAENEISAAPQSLIGKRGSVGFIQLRDHLITAVGMMVCASIMGAWISLLLWSAMHLIATYDADAAAVMGGAQMPSPYGVEYWRKRAAETREQANSIANPGAKRILLGIATNYDELSGQVDAQVRAKSLPAPP
jgi:hypothetical protein